jgi:hypothetical protein
MSPTGSACHGLEPCIVVGSEYGNAANSRCLQRLLLAKGGSSSWPSLLERCLSRKKDFGRSASRPSLMLSFDGRQGLRAKHVLGVVAGGRRGKAWLDHRGPFGAIVQLVKVCHFLCPTIDFNVPS